MTDESSTRAAPARVDTAPMIRGVHVLGLMAILLAAVSVRATEVYTTRYQSLPVLDWVESRPPLAEAANVPTATWVGPLKVEFATSRRFKAL